MKNLSSSFRKKNKTDERISKSQLGFEESKRKMHLHKLVQINGEKTISLKYE